MSSILCCIPARFSSTRLPGKPLLKINGKSIIQHVYERALQTNVTKTIVLTDDERIYNEVQSFGGECQIISAQCLNGTERIIEYLNEIDHTDFNIVVNIQGDEPFFNVENVNKAIDNFVENAGNIVCSTICIKSNDINEVISRSRGKVIVDEQNNILYCSRNPIPCSKQHDVIPGHHYNIHVGIFVFDKKYLLNTFAEKNTTNQTLEDIEWLKIIERGYKINTVFVESAERGVDTPEDYEYLRKKYTQKLDIIVDIDETICKKSPNMNYALAEPIPERIAKVNALYDAGHNITYWTARGTKTGIKWFHVTQEQLNKWGCKYHELRMNKPAYDLMICDKTRHPETEKWNVV